MTGFLFWKQCSMVYKADRHAERILVIKLQIVEQECLLSSLKATWQL